MGRTVVERCGSDGVPSAGANGVSGPSVTTAAKGRDGNATGFRVRDVVRGSRERSALVITKAAVRLSNDLAA
ncbi:hypothetical protein MBEHAL_1833 [Halarchaeum acidiphilum MH1-52-1]|uniref:Uncharacterized protein n=1 Tax=Halarchaeum acidiphilum MH1-52-1 TaxID=1261545 RepID=U3AE74_9EURY|nr:hypothetical protein MBEHAL_1833 [Halarchaeum acidiphilum MH1-52-1]